MTTKWNIKRENKGKIDNIEGFAIFDDSYFKNCVDYLSKGTTSNDFADGLRNIIQYLTCPVYKFDTLVDDVLKEFIKATNKIPCPDVANEPNILKAPVVFDMNLDATTLKNINQIISNHKWIVTQTIANNVLYCYILTKESQELANGINGIHMIDQYNTKSNQPPGKFNDEQLSDFNSKFDSALTSKIITRDILNFDNQNSIMINTYGNILDLKHLLFDESNPKSSIIIKIVTYIDNQLKQVSNSESSISTNPDINYNTTLTIDDYNGPDAENILNRINSIISDHSDWIVEKKTADNILYYFLNSKNSEETDNKSKFSDDQFNDFSNEFNASLYDQDIINLFLTLNGNLLNNDKKLNLVSDDNVKKIINNVCTHLNSDDIKNDAKIIKGEIYNFLMIPLILFITYNFYYTFFYNNIYNNPEVYLKDIRTDFYELVGFKRNTEKEIENSYLGFFINLATKPFQLLYNNVLNPLYLTTHGPKFKFKNSILLFVFLYFMNFVSMGLGGGYIFKMIKGLFTMTDSSLKNDIIYGFIYGLSYAIIMLFFLKWAFNRALQPSYTPIIIVPLMNIFKKFIVILIRFIVSTMSVQIATLICFFYIMFYLFGAMKFASIRGNIVNSIKEINKTLIDEKEADPTMSNKFCVFLYNSIVDISCFFIILISIFSAKYIQSTPVHLWFIKINIILLVIVFSFIFKELTHIFPGFFTPLHI